MLQPLTPTEDGRCSRPAHEGEPLTVVRRRGGPTRTAMQWSTRHGTIGASWAPVVGPTTENAAMVKAMHAHLPPGAAVGRRDVRSGGHRDDRRAGWRSKYVAARSAYRVLSRSEADGCYASLNLPFRSAVHLRQASPAGRCWPRPEVRLAPHVRRWSGTDTHASRNEATDRSLTRAIDAGDDAPPGLAGGDGVLRVVVPLVSCVTPAPPTRGRRSRRARSRSTWRRMCRIGRG